MSKRQQISVPIDTELHETLGRVAAKEHRTLSGQVGQHDSKREADRRSLTAVHVMSAR